MISGVCRFCGCTTERACRPPGGEPCQWVDQEETLCSGCVWRLSDDELQAFFLEEFTGMARLDFPSIEVDVATAYTIVAGLQVALKHPRAAEQPAASSQVRKVAHVIADTLSELGPFTAESLRRGFIGCYEPPVELSCEAHSPPESRIIIPGA
jgi:hypothetical protein